MTMTTTTRNSVDGCSLGPRGPNNETKALQVGPIVATMHTDELVTLRDPEVAPGADRVPVPLRHLKPLVVDQELAGLVHHADPTDVTRILLLVDIDILDCLLGVKFHPPVGFVSGSGSPYVGTRDAAREMKPDSVEMGTDKLARTDLNPREFYSLTQVELL